MGLLLTFKEIASLYGEESALEMVKIAPLSLAWNRSYFAPSFEIFRNKFGTEEAIEMVKRNPGLLGVSPVAAAKTDDSAMTFSSIIAATRPLGKYGVYFLFALLSEPLLENIVDFPLQQKILT